jgi:hypothetical protein
VPGVEGVVVPVMRSSSRVQLVETFKRPTPATLQIV